MSFPKAKVKRFNELKSCAPPVGLYDPKMMETVLVPTLDTKDERFKEPKAPLTCELYRMVRSSSVGSRTPSISSNSPIAENFATPKSTSTNTITARPSDREKHLNKQLRQVVTERNGLHQKWSKKVEELSEAEKLLESVLDEKLQLEGEMEVLREEVGRLKLEGQPAKEDFDTRSFDANLRDENKSLEQKIYELGTTLDREKKSNVSKEEELNQLKDVIARKDSKLRELQKSLTENQDKVEEERSRVELLRSELIYLDGELERIATSAGDDRTTELIRVLKEKEIELQRLENSFVASNIEWESKVQGLVENKKDESSEIERNLDTESKKRQELIENINQLSIHLDEEIKLKLRAERNLEVVESEVDRLESDAASKNSELETLRTSLKSGRDLLEEEKERSATLTSQLEHLDLEMKELTDSASKQDKRIIDLESIIKEKDDELLSLEAWHASFVEEYEMKINKLIESHQVELLKGSESISELELKLERAESSKDLLEKQSIELVEEMDKVKSEFSSLRENYAMEIEVKDSLIEKLNKTLSSFDEGRDHLHGIIEKLEMETKIQKLDLETELREKEDKIRDLENQVSNEKRNFLLLEGNLNKKLKEGDTTIEILTRKTKESDRTHQSDVSKIKDLETKLSQTKETLNLKESTVSKMELKIERLKKSEEDTRTSFEQDCSSLLNQIDEHKYRREEAELKNDELIGLLRRLEAESNSSIHELVKRVELSEDEKMRIMHEHLMLGQEHQRIIFELRQIHSIHEGNTKDLMSRYEMEMKRFQSDADNKVSKLMQEREKWKAQFEDLSEKVEPFRHLLEKYELEKQVLLNKNESAQREAEKLSVKYAELMGHQNHKQKIQHVAKLKEENMNLKDTLAKLQAKDSMNRKRIEKLTGQLEALEGRRRFDPSTAFGLNRTNQGAGDNEVNRRETYNLAKSSNPVAAFSSARHERIKEETTDAFFMPFDGRK